MSGKHCSHQRCVRTGEMGMGWGLSTGLVQWYCADHFVPALTRLSGLLAAARRTAVARAGVHERLAAQPVAAEAAPASARELGGAGR